MRPISELDNFPDTQGLPGEGDKENDELSLVTAITRLTAVISALSNRIVEELSIREENKNLRYRLEQQQRPRSGLSKDDEAIINGTFQNEQVR